MLRYDAPRLLKAFLDSKKPLTQAEAAKQLGIVPSALWGYLNKTQRPRDEVRERIARWSGGKVPVNSWRTVSEARGIDGQDEAVIPEPLPDAKKSAKPAA
jgi:transcriptional regulator with XRE-family HTH domain